MIDFERLLGTLAWHEVAFVVVGGVAATVHGSARLTADLDVVYEARQRTCGVLPPRLRLWIPTCVVLPRDCPFSGMRKRFDAA